MRKVLSYDIDSVAPYINWIYFFHAWGLSGKPAAEKQSLRKDAENMLEGWTANYHTHAAFALLDANSSGDDILVGDERLPMLRQQRMMEKAAPNLCLADFIRPASMGQKDRIGIFATTVDKSMESLYTHDDYRHMMAQTLADRLAEATAEKMHEEVRTRFWGYAPDEHLSIGELHQEAFQGIRPAVGYPSMPDTSMNFLLDRLLDFSSIGIRLTPSGAMMPHASVSGMLISHPQARHFSVGKIDEAQLKDYALRRGIPLEIMRKFLAASL